MAENTTLSVYFKFVDEESGLDHYKFQIYQTHQGIAQQVVPDNEPGSWLEVRGDVSRTTYSHSGIQLKQGGLYSFRVGAVNKAGFVAAFDTSGVVIDNEPPMIHWLKVGTLSDGHEDDIEGYVWQADVTGIKAAWDADDHQSGIVGYKVAVGTSKDVLTWTDYGTENDVHISGLTLTVTNQTSHIPVYYVSLKAINGAGLESSPVISTLIMVVEEDEAGIVVDGADRTEIPVMADIGEDVDYQSDMSTVSVQFTGFESHLHGMMAYEWAVGTTPGGEEIQPFMPHGIIHIEEQDVKGEGVTSSGYAQITLPLEPETTYYTTVRGITNAGNVIEATSDGFTVDITPPDITVDRFR